MYSGFIIGFPETIIYAKYRRWATVERGTRATSRLLYQEVNPFQGYALFLTKLILIRLAVVNIFNYICLASSQCQDCGEALGAPFQVSLDHSPRTRTQMYSVH